MRGDAVTDGKRKLCVGRGGRCFACGGRGASEQGARRSGGELVPVRACPVCGGCGRAIVVDSGDGRTGLLGGPS